MDIEKAGGKCIYCGYNKNERALSFHHKDPKYKEFPLSLNVLWGKKWELILKEFGKCELVCLNCHAEIEGEIAKQNPNYYGFFLD